MKRRAIRVLLWTLLTAVVLAAAGALAAQLRWRRTFEAPYPGIHAVSDPAVIERGRYLVYGPAACAYCHVPREGWDELDRGAMPLLSGNHVFRLPFGTFYSPNLTPHPEFGIGRRTDGELARILRYGVRADGRAAFPFMEYHDLADADLTAIVSFLRAQPIVAVRVPEHEMSMTGKVLMAFVIGPSGPTGSIRTESPPAPSVERGEYLANVVSSCASCHTDRSPRDGSPVGPKFGGGQRMDIAADSTKVFVPPNLTPDPATSPIGRWTEEEFVTRFHHGPMIPGTPMPWGAFARMTDVDVRSTYRYLRTLPPFEHHTGAVVQDK